MGVRRPIRYLTTFFFFLRVFLLLLLLLLLITINDNGNVKSNNQAHMAWPAHYASPSHLSAFRLFPFLIWLCRTYMGMRRLSSAS